MPRLLRFARKDPKGALYLTLNPVEAQYAALVVNNDSWKVSVILRGQGDKAMEPIAMATLSELFK